MLFYTRHDIEEESALKMMSQLTLCKFSNLVRFKFDIYVLHCLSVCSWYEKRNASENARRDREQHTKAKHQIPTS